MHPSVSNPSQKRTPGRLNRYPYPAPCSLYYDARVSHARNEKYRERACVPPFCLHKGEACLSNIYTYDVHTYGVFTVKNAATHQQDQVMPKKNDFRKILPTCEARGFACFPPCDVCQSRSNPIITSSLQTCCLVVAVVIHTRLPDWSSMYTDYIPLMLRVYARSVCVHVP